MLNEGRIKCFDCTRAICMLYIIGIWHFQEYFIADIDLSGIIAENITNGVLGAFTFISAYFLGKRAISNITDVFSFYKKRVVRLYPLFFLSCTSFLIIHFLFGLDYIDSVQQYILTLLGLSTIISPPPMTIWFVSMLILFYLITPFINMVNKIQLKAAVNILILIVLFLLHQIGFVDNRVIMLFPMYAIGLMVAKLKKINDKSNFFLVLLSFFIFLISVWLQLSIEKLLVFDYITVLSITVFSIEIGKLLSMSSGLSKVLNFISYGSMVAYLFHRQYFGMLVIIFGKFSILGGYCLILPSIVVISYCVQKYYDGLILKSKYINNRRLE